jgi:predicted MFS family arabinose efflux permease
MNPQDLLAGVSAVGQKAARALQERMVVLLGGAARTRVILVLAGVLGLSGADMATVGASARALRHGLHITNTDVGLLVTVSSLVAVMAALPFGVLADRVRRTWTLSGAIVLWGLAMLWSASAGSFGELLLARVFLGAVTAAAGPFVASLVGDYFPAGERGRVYGFILAGELLGSGFGFAVTGDIAALSWRAALVVLALPAFLLAWLLFHLPEPPRGGTSFAVRPRGKQSEHVTAQELSGPTDAQHLARDRGIAPDPRLVLHGDIRRLRLVAAARRVVRVRTNLVLIASSACAHYFLAGMQTFGLEFAQDQYRIGQALANLLLLVIGVGAVLGVIAGGLLGDALIRRRHLNGRVLTSAIAATATTILFIPALLAHGTLTAVPYLCAAAFTLSAQTAPLDAARLDVMPPQLWGRAESIRSVIRSFAQALAPLLFGVISDEVFGGGRSGLQLTFTLMLLPLAASAALLYRALGTYPRDVATAAATATEQLGAARLRVAEHRSDHSTKPTALERPHPPR